MRPENCNKITNFTWEFSQLFVCAVELNFGSDLLVNLNVFKDKFRAWIIVYDVCILGKLLKHLLILDFTYIW